MIRPLGCAVCAIAWSSASLASEPVRLDIGPEEAVLSGEHLRLEFTIRGDRVGLRSVHNLRSGCVLELDGSDFRIDLTGGGSRTPSDLRLTRVTDGPAPGGGRRLTLSYEGDGLEVRSTTELRPGRWWATRWLELRGGGEITRVTLATWTTSGARGPRERGPVLPALGYPTGCGQAVYANDTFVAIAHPGAENLVTTEGAVCSIPDYRSLDASSWLRSPSLWIGAGEEDDAWRALIRAVEATRPVKAGMVCLVNDWYWKDKSRPLDAFRALARIREETGVPIDSFTLDDGWDFDWDEATGLWGRLGRQRFPGGWDALRAVGRPAGIDVSLWFGPIGGYTYRPRRVAFGQTAGYEVYGDKLCLSGSRYGAHVRSSFTEWARRGMDYIKVDGFWPECRAEDHGHPHGPGAAIAHIDSLIGTFRAWREGRPDLRIGYTSGSNPSPFWLPYAGYLWRGGRDDAHAGTGEPFDRHATFIDRCLQAHRMTDLPISALVTFDIVHGRVAAGSAEAFERGCWWLAGRTSLHHDWYVRASDLTADEWRVLARAAHWARRHEAVFRFGRMVGGDPREDEIYGFSAWDGRRGTLALRNPGGTGAALSATLAGLLELPAADRREPLRLRSVYGATASLAGERHPTRELTIELPPLEIALLEVER